MLLPLLLLLAQHGQPSTYDYRNALLVILDDVALPDLDTVIMPTLDSLADTGVRFTAAYSNPNCLITRRSLLFGEWHVGPGGPACDPDYSLAPALSLVSLAELVPVHAAMAGKWHLGGNPGGAWECAPQDQGFEVWIAGLAGNVKACDGTGYSEWDRVEGCTHGLEETYHPQATTDALKSWWQATPGRKLGVMSLNLAHVPFHAPPPGLLPVGFPTPATNLEKFQAMMIAYDTLIGELLCVVDMSETLVVVVGDNGTPPQVAPNGAKAKGTTFERGINVPLIISSAWIQPGESSALTHVVDVYATIADMLGGVASGDGVSLRGALIGAPAPGHEYILSGLPGDVCARSLTYKLRRVGTIESFHDLVADPLENVNLILEPSLQATIEAHRNWLDAHLP